MSVSLEEKETSVLASALALALTLALFQYPERDLNPHSRYGHRILSPACLPFHHPGLPLKLMVSLVFDYQKELVHLSSRMVECPPHKLAASLKTPTGCFLNARPYHPGRCCLAVLKSCSRK